MIVNYNLVLTFNKASHRYAISNIFAIMDHIIYFNRGLTNVIRACKSGSKFENKDCLYTKKTVFPYTLVSTYISLHRINGNAD